MQKQKKKLKNLKEIKTGYLSRKFEIVTTCWSTLLQIALIDKSTHAFSLLAIAGSSDKVKDTILKAEELVFKAYR